MKYLTILFLLLFLLGCQSTYINFDSKSELGRKTTTKISDVKLIPFDTEDYSFSVGVVAGKDTNTLTNTTSYYVLIIDVVGPSNPQDLTDVNFDFFTTLRPYELVQLIEGINFTIDNWKNNSNKENYTFYRFGSGNESRVVEVNEESFRYFPEVEFTAEFVEDETRARMTLYNEDNPYTISYHEFDNTKELLAFKKALDNSLYELEKMGLKNN